MKILNIILILAILLLPISMADSGVYDNVNHNENDVYNVTNVNATSFYGDFIGSSTAWITMTSLQSKWFADVGNVLTFDEVELNTTIDARDTDTTYTAGSGLTLTTTSFSVNEDIVFDEVNVSTALTVNNNNWLRSLNNAGTAFVNMFKVNSDDVIEAGANLSIGSISIVEDSGVISLVDMSVSSSPASGTDEGYNFSVDGQTFLKLFADADSAGSISNKTVWVSDDVNIAFDNGAYISVNSTCMSMYSPNGLGIIDVCD